MVKIITADNMGDSTKIVNGKLEIKLDPSSDNLLRIQRNGLTLSAGSVREFIENDGEITRLLSSSDSYDVRMRDFCIFDRFDSEHQQLNGLSNNNPLVLFSSNSTNRVQVKFPFQNAGGRKAVGVYHIWYTFKDEKITDNNPVYIANVLQCNINDSGTTGTVNNCNPIMVVNPFVSKYAVLSVTENSSTFTISRLPDSTGFNIYIHFITLTGAWNDQYTR